MNLVDHFFRCPKQVYFLRRIGAAPCAMANHVGGMECVGHIIAGYAKHSQRSTLVDRVGESQRDTEILPQLLVPQVGFLTPTLRESDDSFQPFLKEAPMVN